LRILFINIKFTPITYTLTFTEQGLPSGTSWSVTVNGTTKSSSTSTITFTLTQGYYKYTINNVSGYNSNVTSGNVNLVANTTISIKFSPINYFLTFTEQGLPSGTTWSVTVNGTTKSSNTSSIVFTLPEGIYYYIVNTVSGYYSNVTSGSISLITDVNVNIDFTSTSNSLVIKVVNSNGQPVAGASVTINGVTETTNSNGIAVFANISQGNYTITIGNLTSGNYTLEASYNGKVATQSLSTSGQSVTLVTKVSSNEIKISSITSSNNMIYYIILALVIVASIITVSLLYLKKRSVK